MIVQDSGELSLFLKFGLVGAAGFVVDALALQTGLALGQPAALARVVSILIAMQATFALNNAFVFRRHRRRPLSRRWLGFMAANAFGALCSYALFVGLIATGLPWISAPLPALAIASAAAWAVNYAGSRMLAFRA
ncbi:MAG: GtrA family protein [Pseudomonadota bacterium]|nr:GtrA family protein [Pseudomonadota bacterium]